MNEKSLSKTHGKILQRVAKTDTNIHGIRKAETVPARKLSLVIFGGERTVKNKDANWYMSMFERLLHFYNIHDVNIYSAVYDFESTNRKPERTNAFIAAGHKIARMYGATTPIDTQYIDDLYRTVVRPRFINKNNEILSEIDAINNVRQLIIFDHCHGATPVRAFQDIMASDMEKSGYTPSTIRKIMKNLLVIQHAPVAPLEKSRFNTVSFMSANDTLMNFYNKISEYIADNNADVLPSYISLGNFFVTHAFTYQYLDEHSIIGLVPNEIYGMLTPDGEIIMAAERNAIINGIRAAQQGAPMPTIRELIAPASDKDAIKPDFDTLMQNGESLMNMMRYDMAQEKSKER